MGLKNNKKIKEIRYSVAKRILNIFFEDGTMKGYTGKFAEEAIQRYVYQNERNIKPEKIKQYDKKHNVKPKKIL